MGRIVSKKELAEIVGVSERTLSDWQEKGMPIKVHTSRGLANEYDTSEVFNWRVEFVAGGMRKENGRERKDNAMADLYQIQVAEKSGRLVDGALFQKALETSITTAKTSLRQSAKKMKAALKREYGVDVELGFFAVHIDAALTRLSECRPELADDTE
jgi:phage terminase Nu1 subunit (DNA packaging protein)